MPKNRDELLSLASLGRGTGMVAWFVAASVLFTGAGLLFQFDIAPEKNRADRTFQEFVLATCHIRSSQIVEETSDDSTTYCPTFKFVVDTRQTVEGGGPGVPVSKEVTGYDGIDSCFGDSEDAQAEVNRFAAGKDVACWADPVDPARSVLVRSGFQFGTLLLASYAAFAGIWCLAASWRARRPVHVRHRDDYRSRVRTDWGARWVGLSAFVPLYAGLTIAVLWGGAAPEVWMIVLAATAFALQIPFLIWRSLWDIDHLTGFLVHRTGFLFARKETRWSLAQFQAVTVEEVKGDESTNWSVRLTGSGDAVELASAGSEAGAVLRANAWAEALRLRVRA
jgi:hypothetical protein